MPYPQADPPTRRHGVRRAAVLGKPIDHSLSPVLHSAAYRELGLRNWLYTRHECDEDGLAGFVAGLGPEWAGLSLTMPLKRAALRLATEVTPLAQATGAANTLIFRSDAGPLADNTDIDGIITALREVGVDRVERGVILGAGGTAQAALAALRDLGGTAPTALVRDAGRSTQLQATADRLGIGLTVLDGVPDRPLPPADVVISTLPGHAADPYAGTAWLAGTVVMDVVYEPWPTALAESAVAAGCRVCSGLDVLLHQAVRQVLLMTGRPGPVEPMRAALQQEIRHRRAPATGSLSPMVRH